MATKQQHPFVLKIKAFFTHWVVKNLLIAIGIVLVMVLSVHLFLSIYTRHGKQIAVPDFIGMTLGQAERIAGDHDIEIVVTDSVFFSKSVAPGTVLEQSPRAGSGVKKGRHISVRIQSFLPQMVQMPNLVDLSLRQAITNINSKGLQLGKLIYRTSKEGTNLVLEQHYRGRKIATGKELVSGSVIDLVLGQMPEDTDTYVPDVMGKDYRNAVTTLHDNSLNVRCRFDKSVRTYEDSLRAVVYRQSPESSTLPIVRGKEITLHLRPVESPEE